MGSHLCERLLKEGHEVVCLDNFFTGSRSNVEHLLDHHRFELMRHDVTEPLTMEVDEVFHLACPASPIHYQRNPVRTIRTAVEGTLNMLDLAREAKARVLIASTSEVYGDPIEHPQHESYWGNVNPIGPRACYDEGKRCAEALAVSYARQYSVEVRIARIFNTYGPRMHENDGRVVSNFVVQALRNESITVYGEGQQTRSFCFVSDLIEGFIRLMASPHGADPVNLGNPRETTVLELAEMTRKLTKSSSGDHPRAAAQGQSDPAQAGHLARAAAPRWLGAGRAARAGAGRDHRRLQAPAVRLTDGSGAARSSGSPVTGCARPGTATSASGMRTNGRSRRRGWGRISRGGSSMIVVAHQQQVDVDQAGRVVAAQPGARVPAPLRCPSRAPAARAGTGRSRRVRPRSDRAAAAPAPRRLFRTARTGRARRRPPVSAAASPRRLPPRDRPRLAPNARYATFTTACIV